VLLRIFAVEPEVAVVDVVNAGRLRVHTESKSVFAQFGWYTLRGNGASSSSTSLLHVSSSRVRSHSTSATRPVNRFTLPKRVSPGLGMSTLSIEIRAPSKRPCCAAACHVTPPTSAPAPG
jgi:hypothetical protein